MTHVIEIKNESNYKDEGVAIRQRGSVVASLAPREDIRMGVSVATDITFEPYNITGVEHEPVE